MPNDKLFTNVVKQYQEIFTYIFMKRIIAQIITAIHLSADSHRAPGGAECGGIHRGGQRLRQHFAS